MSDQKGWAAPVLLIAAIVGGVAMLPPITEQPLDPAIVASIAATGRCMDAAMAIPDDRASLDALTLCIDPPVNEAEIDAEIEALLASDATAHAAIGAQLNAALGAEIKATGCRDSDDLKACLDEARAKATKSGPSPRPLSDAELDDIMAKHRVCLADRIGGVARNQDFIVAASRACLAEAGD